MKCNVEYTDEFGSWWNTLSEDEQEDIAAIVSILEEKETRLPFPFSTGVERSNHSHMRGVKGSKQIKLTADLIRL